jgi:His-Xaa-Ser system protein HxsD
MITKKRATMHVLKIDPRIYPLRVVYSCAYVFLERAYIMLDGDPKRRLIVSIKSKDGGDSKKLAGEFLNELLNASLRYQISKENRKLREYIVGSALISVSQARNSGNDGQVKNRHAAMNLGRGRDAANHKQPAAKEKKIPDPQGIAIPWEEKYGKCDRDKVQ